MGAGFSFKASFTHVMAVSVREAIRFGQGRPKDSRPVGEAPDIFVSRREGIHPAVGEAIRQELARCRYGKDIEGVFAREAEPFKVRPKGLNKLSCVGFDSPAIFAPPESMMPLKGLCHELAFPVARRLTSLFGGQYDFFITHGNCGQYFFPSAGNHLFIHVQDRSEPHRQWILDPSFGKFMTAEAARKEGYTWHELMSCTEYERTRRELGYTLTLSPGQARSIPMGYLSDMLALEDCPVPVQSFHKTAMVHLTVSQGNLLTPLDFGLALQLDSTMGMRFAPELESALPQDNPLDRLLRHLRGQNKAMVLEQFSQGILPDPVEAELTQFKGP